MWSRWPPWPQPGHATYTPRTAPSHTAHTLVAARHLPHQFAQKSRRSNEPSSRRVAATGPSSPPPRARSSEAVTRAAAAAAAAALIESCLPQPPHDEYTLVDVMLSLRDALSAASRASAAAGRKSPIACSCSR